MQIRRHHVQHVRNAKHALCSTSACLQCNMFCHFVIASFEVFSGEIVGLAMLSGSHRGFLRCHGTVFWALVSELGFLHVSYWLVKFVNFLFHNLREVFPEIFKSWVHIGKVVGRYLAMVLDFWKQKFPEFRLGWFAKGFLKQFHRKLGSVACRR